MNFKNSNIDRKPASVIARLAATLLIVACLTGCGKSLSGTYAGDTILGSVSVEFKGGHKAFSSMGGQTRELAYTIEGDKLILDTGKGKEVWTIQKDGSLSRGNGMMSVTLKRK